MPGNKTVTWVAVLDSEKAFFYTKGPEKKLGELNHTLTAHPVRTNNETRRVLGRVHDRHGPARHIEEPHIEDKVQDRTAFVKEVVDYLITSLTAQQYNRLVIVAPPKVLGLLRKLLTKEVKETIVLELDKDLIHLKPAEIQKQLEEIVYI